MVFSRSVNSRRPTYVGRSSRFMFDTVSPWFFVFINCVCRLRGAVNIMALPERCVEFFAVGLFIFLLVLPYSYLL